MEIVNEYDKALIKQKTEDYFVKRIYIRKNVPKAKQYGRKNKKEGKEKT